MSNKEILDSNSKIYGQYLPSAPAPHPYVENPMVENLNTAGFDIDNVGNIIGAGNLDLVLEYDPNQECLIKYGNNTAVQIDNTGGVSMYNNLFMVNNGNITVGSGEVIFDTNTGILASSTAPDVLELVAVNGATVGVSDKSKIGQVNDFVFNNPFNMRSVTAPFPYNGGLVYHGQITRVYSNTTGSPGELVLEEQYPEKLTNIFGIIADPANTTNFNIEYSDDPTNPGSFATLAFTTADNGKLIWCMRVSPTSVIRLG